MKQINIKKRMTAILIATVLILGLLPTMVIAETDTAPAVAFKMDKTINGLDFGDTAVSVKKDLAGTKFYVYQGVYTPGAKAFAEGTLNASGEIIFDKELPDGEYTIVEEYTNAQSGFAVASTQQVTVTAMDEIVTTNRYISDATYGTLISARKGENSQEWDLPDVWNGALAGNSEFATLKAMGAQWIWNTANTYQFGTDGGIFETEIDVYVEKNTTVPFYFAADNVAAVYVNGKLAFYTDVALDGRGLSNDYSPNVFGDFNYSNFNGAWEEGWTHVYEKELKLTAGDNKIIIIAANSAGTTNTGTANDGYNNTNNPCGVIFGFELSSSTFNNRMKFDPRETEVGKPAIDLRKAVLDGVNPAEALELEITDAAEVKYQITVDNKGTAGTVTLTDVMNGEALDFRNVEWDAEEADVEVDEDGNLVIKIGESSTIVITYTLDLSKAGEYINAVNYKVDEDDGKRSNPVTVEVTEPLPEIKVTKEITDTGKIIIDEDTGIAGGEKNNGKDYINIETGATVNFKVTVENIGEVTVELNLTDVIKEYIEDLESDGEWVILENVSLGDNSTFTLKPGESNVFNYSYTFNIDFTSADIETLKEEIEQLLKDYDAAVAQYDSLLEFTFGEDEDKIEGAALVANLTQLAEDIDEIITELNRLRDLFEELGDVGDVRELFEEEYSKVEALQSEFADKLDALNVKLNEIHEDEEYNAEKLFEAMEEAGKDILRIENEIKTKLQALLEELGADSDFEDKNIQELLEILEDLEYAEEVVFKVLSNLASVEWDSDSAFIIVFPKNYNFDKNFVIPYLPKLPEKQTPDKLAEREKNPPPPPAVNPTEPSTTTTTAPPPPPPAGGGNNTGGNNYDGGNTPDTQTPTEVETTTAGTVQTPTAPAQETTAAPPATTAAPAPPPVTIAPFVEPIIFEDFADDIIPLADGYFAMDLGDDIYEIFDEEGVPLGIIQLEESQDIEEYFDFDSIMPLASFVFTVDEAELGGEVAGFSAENIVTETNKNNPKTGSNVLPILLIFATIPAIVTAVKRRKAN